MKHIRSFEELLSIVQVGQVYCFVRPGKRTTFVRVRDARPQIYHGETKDGVRGIPADCEKRSPDASESVAPILETDFLNEGIFLADESEYVGKDFSYEPPQ